MRVRGLRTGKLTGIGAVVVVFGTMVWATPSALAINSYHAEPAPERTEAGALVVQWNHDDDPATPDRIDWVCSGAMIDADTFLTAAHCVTDWSPNVRFYVSLDQDVQAALDRAAARHPGDPGAIGAEVGVEGTAHWDSAYPGSSADSHDIAVVELPAAKLADRWTFTPARLPRAGQLDAMGPQTLDDTDFLVVGYGTQEAQRGPGGHRHPGGGVRMKAPESFNALNYTWIRLAMTEPQGNGGACYGDSGGPNYALVDGGLLLVGTTITGDVPCYATNVAYRTDSPSARAFLSRYVDLP